MSTGKAGQWLTWGRLIATGKPRDLAHGIEVVRRPAREELVSPKELADRLGVPVTTIYGWRYKGVGPKGRRVGKHVRYWWSDVLEWLDRHEVSKSPPAQRARSQRARLRYATGHGFSCTCRAPADVEN